MSVFELDVGYRPWGRYVVLDEGMGYKVKRIVVHPYQALSLQSHKHRSERWTVVRGKATIEVGETKAVLEPGETAYIPLEFKHRLSNYGAEDLVLIEVQFGSYLGEDDITRYQDIYGRTE